MSKLFGGEDAELYDYLHETPKTPLTVELTNKIIENGFKIVKT